MANWKIFYFLLTYVKSQTLIVNRNSTGDTLKCDTSVRCSELSAKQISKSLCLCSNSGTILTPSNRCSTNGGCKFYIYPLKTSIYTISYKQNLNAVLKSSDTVNSEKITSVQILNQNMEWEYLSFHGFSLVRGGALMLTNNRYSKGELLKINLNYKSNNNQSDESCVMIKIEGDRYWKNSDLAKPICGAVEKPTAYTIARFNQTEKTTIFHTKTAFAESTTKSKPSTQPRTLNPNPETQTTTASSTPNTKIKTTSADKQFNNMPQNETHDTQTKSASFTTSILAETATPSLHNKVASTSKVIGLTVTAVFLLIIVLFATLCIVICVKRRKTKPSLQKSSEPDIQEESPYDSAEGYTAFQNQNYLASIPLCEQSKLKTEIKTNIDERQKNQNVDEGEYSTLFQTDLPKKNMNKEYFSLENNSSNYSSLNDNNEITSYTSLNQPEYQCIN
ncbi:uncharacterized protein LOC101238080 isoform X2 [Hydra vulgaris]|uniref:Uncharacterized protein LOC101238080 isoform X2 n=1 Tax=Hydra vulgaris TaxID=6087 RepID=A0ABM4D6D9_HYDVU